jgi:hypothetical protein
MAANLNLIWIGIAIFFILLAIFIGGTYLVLSLFRRYAVGKDPKT